MIVPSSAGYPRMVSKALDAIVQCFGSSQRKNISFIGKPLPPRHCRHATAATPLPPRHCRHATAAKPPSHQATAAKHRISSMLPALLYPKNRWLPTFRPSNFSNPQAQKRKLRRKPSLGLRLAEIRIGYSPETLHQASTRKYRCGAL